MDGRLSSVLCLGVAEWPALSVKRFSSVARSVLPSSSSGITPDRRISVSIRARRFSSPSMYLALLPSAPVASVVSDLPFRGLPLLLHLREYAFRLVVLAMCTRWHLAVALDLLLAAHIACLQPVSIVPPAHTLYVPVLYVVAWDHWNRHGRRDRHSRRGRTLGPGAFARGRIGRCQRCAGAGSSWAARHSSRWERCSWWRVVVVISSVYYHVYYDVQGAALLCDADEMRESEGSRAAPDETVPRKSPAGSYRGCRRLAGGRIASTGQRVRQKLVWSVVVVVWCGV
jgi:hypothetical protein